MAAKRCTLCPEPQAKDISSSAFSIYNLYLTIHASTTTAETDF